MHGDRKVQYNDEIDLELDSHIIDLLTTHGYEFIGASYKPQRKERVLVFNREDLCQDGGTQ